MNEMFLNKELIERALESFGQKKEQEISISFSYEGVEFCIVEKEKISLVNASQTFGEFSKEGKDFVIFR